MVALKRSASVFIAALILAGSVVSMAAFAAASICGSLRNERLVDDVEVNVVNMARGDPPMLLTSPLGQSRRAVRGAVEVGGSMEMLTLSPLILAQSCRIASITVVADVAMMMSTFTDVWPVRLR